MAGIEGVILPVIEIFMNSILANVPNEKVQDVADDLLDKVENLVDGTGTQIDDAIVEPILNKVRVSFGIEDGDD